MTVDGRRGRMRAIWRLARAAAARTRARDRAARPSPRFVEGLVARREPRGVPRRATFVVVRLAGVLELVAEFVVEDVSV